MKIFSTILSYLQPSLTLFRMQLLAHPKSPSIFAVPSGKRPTGKSGKRKSPRKKQSPRRLFSWLACLTRCAPRQDLEKEIFQISCKARKARCTFAARFNRKRLTWKSQKRELKKLSLLNLESQKLFLPLHSQSQTGLANGKKPGRQHDSHGYANWV